MKTVWTSIPDAIRNALAHPVREDPKVGDQVVSVGIPILLDAGESIRDVKVFVPGDACAP